MYEYPNDAVPASEWPEGVGALTAVGERAHFELGRRLRKRYVDSGFLPFSFSAKDIYLRSTTIDRTLMSAYSQMAGMFPAGTGQVRSSCLALVSLCYWAIPQLIWFC